jgi:ABC-type Fe3+ transport system substrate-binding protein
LSDFEKKFPGIKVKVVSGRGNELLSRMMTERRAGKHLVDVARIGNTSPYSLYQAKALQPIAPAFILPEVRG